MRFTITVNATLNGKPCKNPQVEFIQGEQFIYPCEIDGNQITVEIRPGADPNACIEGYIKCDDTCLNCPPQYFKQCLCNDVTLLQECEKCVDGFIVNACTPEQIAAGMICTPNGCQCPPDKPIKDPNTGQCVQCITGTVQGCKVCVGGTWVDKECGDNEVCDPATGGCVCKPGFVKDPYTNLCVPPPQCSDDADCPTCYTCVLGNCVPIECPPDHKCVNGECIYWPCKDTTCANGADCGDGCGCLNGQCVPCYLLPCRTEENGCVSALGCRCSAEDKCEPVDNCDEACDGVSPCSDPNCTCYNGRCVNCANFPCDPDDCSSRANCGCSGGDCGGGKSCSDNLKLEKKCATTEFGCEVEATFETANKCACDPIIFKTKTRPVNCYLGTLSLTTPEGPNTGGNTPPAIADAVLALDIRLFKGEVPYTDYLKSIQIGDDELVNADIVIKASHYVINSRGVETKVGETDVIKTASVLDNAVQLLKITKTMFKRDVSFTDPFTKKTEAKPTVVKIEVFANNVKIPNNDCVNYGSEKIAEFILDHNNLGATCNRIAVDYILDQVKKVNDGKSNRRPLFVWSKSNTGVFDNKEFDTTTESYAKSGWFRKEYGVKQGGKWVDKITHPREQSNTSGSSNQPYELWANYNYRVQVDCGCKVNTSFLDKLVFCCPNDFEFETSQCNNEFTLQPFNVCAVNGKLSDFERNSPAYKIPNECQVNWMVKLKLKDGEEIDQVIEYDSTTKTKLFKKVLDKKDNPIIGATIYQKFSGGLLTEFECPVDLDIEYDEPEYKIDISCSPIGIIVTQPVGATPKIVDVTGLVSSSPPGVMFFRKDGGAWTSLGVQNQPLSGKTPGNKQVLISFDNGCLVKTNVNITCQPEVNASAVPSPYSDVVCDLSADGPKIVATSVGFTQNVKYSIDGVNYLTSNEFLNNSPGTYTVYAKDTIDGVEYSATTSITILPSQQPIINLTPSTICPGQTATLTITADPGMIFTLYKPGGVAQTVTIPVGGVQTITGINIAGDYTVTQNVAKSGWCFPYSKTTSLSVQGQSLSPSIELQPGSYCQGQPIPFRILDGGINAEYLLTSNGSGTITSPLTAQTSGFNGLYTPNTTNGSIKITGTTGSCNTTTTPQISVVSQAEPTLSNVSVTCANDNTHTVTITTNASSVTIGGVSATNTSGQTWQRTGISGLTEAEIIVSNGVCNKSQTVQLQNCECPAASLYIGSDGDTCGQGNTNIYYLNIQGQVPSISWNYVWQKNVNGTWTNLGAPAAYPVTPYSAPTTVGVVDEYRLLLTNTNNGCNYYSDFSIFVTALQAPTDLFITPSVNVIYAGQPVTFSTVPGYETYTWGGGVVTGSNYISNSVSFQNPGDYTVTVQVCNGICCSTKSITITVEQNCNNPVSCTRIPNGAIPPCQKSIRFNPVGGTGNLYYQVTGDISIGQTLITNGNFEIDLSSLAPGVSASFTVEVYDNSGCASWTETITFTPQAVVLTNDTSVFSTISFDDAINIPNVDFIKVYAATAYKCGAMSPGSGLPISGGTNPVSIFSYPQFDNLQGYIIYKNAPACPLSALDDTDLVTFVNNWLSTNGYSGVIDWNISEPNEITYTVLDSNNEKEKIAFFYVTHVSTAPTCTTYGVLNQALVQLDLPCQCP